MHTAGAEEGEYERLEEESTHEAPTRATGGTRPPVRRLTKRAKQYNYASYDCNAKVLDSNKGSQRYVLCMPRRSCTWLAICPSLAYLLPIFVDRVRSILSDDMDKYALNLCKANIFYVVQLCDDIRIVSLQVGRDQLRAIATAYVPLAPRRLCYASCACFQAPACHQSGVLNE